MGQQGEKNVTSFEFNLSSWKTLYPNGIITLAVIRPGETENDAYSPAQITIDVNGILTWTIDEVDTSLYGRGSFSFAIVDVQHILKSKVVETIIIENLNITGVPPQALTQWLIESNIILNILQNSLSSVLPLSFLDKTVLISDWITSTEFVEYPYEAHITCTNVISSMYAQVFFHYSDAMSNILSPICVTATNEVIIYARLMPSQIITIPIIRTVSLL